MLSSSRPVKHLPHYSPRNDENETPLTGKNKSTRNKRAKLMPKSPYQEKTHED